jgi:hypothetical protein
VIEEVEEWVEDPFYSITRETKYFKIFGDLLDCEGYGGVGLCIGSIWMQGRPFACYLHLGREI